MTTSWSPFGKSERKTGPAFESVAEAHLDDVHAYLVYLTGDRAVAEDLTADTFEKALRAWRRFDPRRASAKTWLCQIARTTALDHFRAAQARKRREDVYAQRELRDAAAPAYGVSPELEAALRSLSRGEREIVALRVVLELDNAITARLLGISATACSTRLSRALQKLEAEVTADAVA